MAVTLLAGSGSMSRAARMRSSLTTVGPPPVRPAGAGGRQALVGVGADECADELRQGGKDVDDQAPARGGGVERLIMSP